jgi:DNA-binding Lrp family transcriptional regulator
MSSHARITNAQRLSVSDTPRRVKLTPLELRLLNENQRDLPLSPTPFADMAERLGVDETTVLRLLKKLQGQGVISRVGPVFRPKRVGVSTLAAMAVPEERLELVAALVNGYGEVNHNYEREHELNLWFVVTAPTREHLQQVLAEIEQRTGIAVMDLPLRRPFHIDLGFPLWC